MQVSTGNTFITREQAYLAGVPAYDLVTVTGTPEQVESLSRAVKRGRAEEKKKAARRAAQRSRRNNRM